MGIVTALAHARGLWEVGVGERLRLVTIKTEQRLRLLGTNVGHAVAVLDAVAGEASQLDGGMDVGSGGVVGMSFLAVGCLVDRSWMRARARVAEGTRGRTLEWYRQSDFPLSAAAHGRA